MSRFTAIVTRRKTLWHLILGLRRRREFEPWMHEFTVFPIGTEAGQIEITQNSPHVPVTTAGSVTTKPSIVPGAIFYLTFWIDMQEGTFLVVTSIEPGVEVAFRHFGHVVLVQEFTLVAFFAQTTKPMLAHYRSVTTNVPEWTSGTFITFGSIGGIEEQTDGGGRLIHPRKRQWKGPELFIEVFFYFKHNIVNTSY